MFSLSKLLFLAAIVAAVWFGFRWYMRLEQSKASKPPGGRITTHDTVRCTTCGVYMTREAGPCGRPDCTISRLA